MHTYESPATKPTSDRLRIIERTSIHFLIMLSLALFAYSNTFDVIFQFDDVFNIVENPLIEDLSNIPSFFAGSKGPFASRPLMHATLALNYYFGGLDTSGYHAVNLAIHLINGVLLYLLVLMTGRHLGREERAVRIAAFLASFLFLVHPIQTQAVTYTISRSMLLATMFYFSGMILFIKAVTSESKRGLWIAGLFVASLLGMASRENFATFPVMLVLYDLFFVSRFRLKEVAGRWRTYLPVFASLGYMFYIVVNNTYDRGADFPGIGVPHVDYFITQFNVHWTYLRLLVLPIGQNIDYDYPIATTLFEFPTLLAFLGYLGLWAVGIGFARRKPILSFPLLWFLVALLPISFLVTFMDLRLDDVIFEHRLYLPGAGLVVLLAVLLTGLAERSRALLPVLIVGVLILGGTAYARNAFWSDGASLWEDAVRKSPRKARPYLNLGFAFESAGIHDKAEEHYLSALRLEPQYFQAHINLGNVYMAEKRYEEAIRHFGMAILISPASAKAYNSLANAYYMSGQMGKANQYFKEALRIERMGR